MLGKCTQWDHIKDVSDIDNLQRGIDNFAKWTEGWQVKLNINECKVISVHHRRYTDSGLIPNYVINNIKLDEVDEIKKRILESLMTHCYYSINTSVKRLIKLTRCWV